jgi:predicted ATP-binding protein involved in virulence
MFTSLNFSNFRGFERLELNGLKRVNLVVGRNNAGKTSLLEGIAIVSDPEQFAQLPKMFRPQAGDAGKRYFRWLLRDQESLQAATLIGAGVDAQKEIIFRLDTNNQEPPAPSMTVRRARRRRFGASPLNANSPAEWFPFNTTRQKNSSNSLLPP